MKAISRFYVPLTLLLIVGVVFVIRDFIVRWHVRGDAFAQAYGSLLAVIVTCVSALITILFLYTTMRALELQREQWRRSIATEPRFWIEKKLAAGNCILGCKENGRTDSFLFDDFDCVIWNYSDKSILISSVNLTDGSDAKHKVIQKVLRPHTVERFSFGLKLLEFYVPDITSSSRGGTEACIVFSSFATQIGGKDILFSLTYSDWMHRDAESEAHRFSICKATNEQSLNPVALAISPTPRLEDEADQTL